MSHLNLSADELLTTTRAVRKRLDLDKPVAMSVLKECLEIALQTPSGSISQGWHFILGTDFKVAPRRSLNHALHTNGW